MATTPNQTQPAPDPNQYPDANAVHPNREDLKEGKRQERAHDQIEREVEKVKKRQRMEEREWKREAREKEDAAERKQKKEDEKKEKEEKKRKKKKFNPGVTIPKYGLHRLTTGADAMRKRPLLTNKINFSGQFSSVGSRENSLLQINDSYGKRGGKNSLGYSDPFAATGMAMKRPRGPKAPIVKVRANPFAGMKLGMGSLTGGSNKTGKRGRPKKRNMFSLGLFG